MSNQFDDEQFYQSFEEEMQNDNGIQYDSYGHESYQKQLTTYQSQQQEAIPVQTVDEDQFLNLDNQYQPYVYHEDNGIITEDSNSLFQNDSNSLLQFGSNIQKQKTVEQQQECQQEHQQNCIVENMENMKQDKNAEENNRDQHKDKSSDMGDHDDIQKMRIEPQNNNNQEQEKEQKHIGDTDSNRVNEQVNILPIKKKIQKNKQKLSPKKQQEKNEERLPSLKQAKENKQQYSKLKKSKFWDDKSLKDCKPFYQFISKESWWYDIIKQAPNLIVYLICNYDKELNDGQWQRIVEELSKKYIDKVEQWPKYLSLNSPIKLIKQKLENKQVDCQTLISQIKPIYFNEFKTQNVSEITYNLSLHWNNFKTLCKDREIDLNLENKHNESFENIQDELQKKLLDNQNINEEYIKNLMILVKQIKYHKKKKFTKKTIDFNITDIYNLYENNELKKQVELIFSYIKLGFIDYENKSKTESEEKHDQFLKYISTGDDDLNERILKHLRLVVMKVEEMKNSQK
ncbi:unnamed protein product [Paramecium pentaurelia]|uniref:Uncharacterized protein n=1 Tax=Paramecium pentaurelia TaxID=43138 RepID=A0A8S1YIZ0_9CILI|nr:unnamed protein product [Paramecium pentaurelia]